MSYHAEVWLYNLWTARDIARRWQSTESELESADGDAEGREIIEISDDEGQYLLWLAFVRYTNWSYRWRNHSPRAYKNSSPNTAASAKQIGR